MRLTTTTLLSLAATSTAAVLPRSQLGSWTLSVSKSAYANGYNSQTATAIYTSDSYPDGITSTCKYVYNPAVAEGEPKETDTCDEGFSYSFDGQTVSLSQVVQKPSAGTTVFGSAPLTLKSDAVGRTFSGEATVEVTEATA
ncbi:hypothetical protein EKO04_007009 [Ascochyta lentis]|uniref:AA1-like domain-containing protein n=1 Tax=Ascochyta lentis TaxID=205686 RepID=A0A8H7IZ06_9PLEO|nr:hypothetical protein EKO04_007009 [Ascochyta lentis]